ncbi:MAG: putative transposase, partial [Actinomycetota bacterium]|nr:putative transposase [Actinomycetota bacterium]
GWVAIEDLRVKNMTKTAKGTKEKPGTNVAQKAGLNRAILDNAWGERRRQLGYKAARHGSELRVVPASGTSQTCSECHVRYPQSRPGCGRVFACTACGHTEHADRNAAKEIESRGEAVGPTVQHASPKGVRAARSRTRELPKGQAHNA